MAPLVSVVIATHDRAELLPGAVASILCQTLRDFELVIVDDASSDATPVVVQELQNRDPRIRSFRTDTNVGPGAARNLGVHHARGTYVAILDDDDLALPERLALQTEQFTHDPGLGLVFSSVAWVDGRGETFAIMHEVVRTGHFPRTPPEVFSLLYLECNKIFNTTIMVRRELLVRYPYPAFPWIGEDWFLCMQLAASGVRMGALSAPLVSMARDSERSGLMSQKQKVPTAQRQVLTMIRTWLRDNDIRIFDSLHRQAFANELVREARMTSGARGVTLCAWALLLEPATPKAWATLGWLARKAYHKAGRSWRWSSGVRPS